MLFLGGLITRPGAILGDMIVLIKAASKQIKQTRPPINTLTLEMIRTKTTLKPKCKTKAAEGRHLLPCVLHMLKMFFPPKNRHQELRLRCVENLSKFYDVLGAPWDAASGPLAAKYARLHLSFYSDLSREALSTLDHHSTGWLRWRLYPKHHLFIHVVEDQIATSGSTCD